MKTTKRSWIIRIAFVLVLVLIAVVMLRIGRGHTVYFDNRAVDKGGQSVEAPYKITVYVNGEQISKLYEKERCLTTVIGDKLELTVEVMQQKGGSETTETYQMTLPHNIDGIIINLPAYMAGLPEEAYLEEFIPAPPTARMSCPSFVRRNHTMNRQANAMMISVSTGIFTPPT